MSLVNQIEELKSELASKNVELAQMQSTLSDMESDPLAHFEDGITSAWDAELNEQYGDMVSGLPFYCGSAAELCEDKDNTFYRCGLSDFADGFDVSNFEEYEDLKSEIEDLEDTIAGIEEEIEELEENDE